LRLARAFDIGKDLVVVLASAPGFDDAPFPGEIRVVVGMGVLSPP
jgi:hypothetical protein